MRKLMKKIMEIFDCGNPARLHEEVGIPRQTAYDLANGRGGSAFLRLMTEGFIEAYERLSKAKKKAVLEKIRKS